MNTHSVNNLLAAKWHRMKTASSSIDKQSGHLTENHLTKDDGMLIVGPQRREV